MKLTLSFNKMARMALLLGVAAGAQAQSERPRISYAVETDALAYALKGYSGIFSVTIRNGFQIAGGTGRYDMPGFLLKGDDNYDQAKWKATVTSAQVLRAGYRFRGPMKSGPIVGAILFNQKYRLQAEKLAGKTEFRTLSAGVTGGYYFHVTKHFYIYPTVAFTRNNVVSGQTSLQGVNYHVSNWGLNETVHVGWEWGR
jgi:hypothetical protein